MSGFHIRHCNPSQDRPGLHRLQESLSVRARRENGNPAIFPIEWDGQTVPEQAWVASLPADPDTIAGFAWCFRASGRRATLGVRVHPDFQRQGLGSSLLETVSAAAEEQEAAELVVYSKSEDKICQAFLKGSGFGLQGQADVLQAPEGRTIPLPVFPAGYFLRKYSELQHLPTLASLVNRTFFDTPLNPANDPKAISDELLQDQMESFPELYPAEGLFLLLDSFGKAVGIVRTHQPGVIYSPGVVPEERVRNLREPLLLVAMAHLRAKGARSCSLFCEGESSAQLSSYRSLGFSTARRFEVWQKSL